jgi:heme exporter protein D
MDLGPHAFFIVASYAFAAAIVLGLIVWIVIDYRTQLRALAELESRGVTRRATAREAEAI